VPLALLGQLAFTLTPVWGLATALPATLLAPVAWIAVLRERRAA
jgi:hypothetical protein